MPALPSKARLPAFLPLIVAVIVGGVAWWADGRVRRALEEMLTADIQTALNANVTALEIWMNTQKRLALGVADDPEVRTTSLALLEPGTGRTNRAPLGPGTPRGSDFDRAVQPRMRTAGFFVAQLVTTNQVIVSGFGRGGRWSGLPVPEEHQAKFAELFATGQPVIITPFKPSFRRGSDFARGRSGEDKRGNPGAPQNSTNAGGQIAGPTPDRNERRPNRGGPGGPPGGGIMQVAAPIRDSDGIVRGAVAFLLNPELEFSRILSVARPGASGETYAFDASGLLLSQSRFDPQLKELGLLGSEPEASSALTLALQDPGGDLTRGFPLPTTNVARPLIRLVASAVQGEDGVEVRSSRDYRGVPVVGGWRWLADHGFGVATQLDATEAFHALRLLRSVFTALIGLLASFAVAGLVITHFNFVWRRKANEAELKLRTLGQYTLEEKIGEGGMGVVYRAHHALLRRETAVKLLLPDRANEATIRQFEQEVRLTCTLTHPNTIQIYDFGRTPDGIFYYAMEYLRGLNLADLISRYGTPPEERILHILLQVCDSLREAHLAGLVHRDIKPANIFLCERGGVPDTVKVLDFGLVQRFDVGESLREGNPARRRLSGTPNYLPPETIRDPACFDPRSDIYALGAVAYFLATAQRLFPVETVTDILDRQLHEAPIAPRSRGAHIGPELEATILACLSKDPAARPATIADLALRLSQCPAAGQWTLERRLAWWTSVVSTASVASAVPTPDAETQRIEATLQVDFTRRTG